MTLQRESPYPISSWFALGTTASGPGFFSFSDSVLLRVLWSYLQIGIQLGWPFKFSQECGSRGGVLLKQESVPSSSIPQQHFLPLTFAFGGLISSVGGSVSFDWSLFFLPSHPPSHPLSLSDGFAVAFQPVVLSLCPSACGQPVSEQWYCSPGIYLNAIASALLIVGIATSQFTTKSCEC